MTVAVGLGRDTGVRDPARLRLHGQVVHTLAVLLVGSRIPGTVAATAAAAVN